jgi:hypothetical protein
MEYGVWIESLGPGGYPVDRLAQCKAERGLATLASLEAGHTEEAQRG